jgi:hypothetical protein
MTEANGEANHWVEIAYFLQMAMNPKTGQFGGVQGNCIGQRSDTKRILGIVILPIAVWPEGFDWQKLARERLETFLDCHCSQFGPCEFHALKTMEWATLDITRANVAPHDLPKVLRDHYKIKSPIIT